MSDANGADICQSMEHYLQYERVAYTATLDNILPSSDYVIDGTKNVDDIVTGILEKLSQKVV